MALQIIHHDGRMRLEETRFLFFSPPKTGKTHLMSGWPDCLFLATEKGYGALVCQVLDIPDWETAEEAVDDIVAGKFDIQTIAIDTIDLLWQYCTEWACAYLGITHVSEAKWAKGYHLIDSRFAEMLGKLFASPYGVLMSSHTVTKDVITANGVITKTVSSLPDRGRNIIIPKMDVIGYMDLKNIRTKEGKWVDVRSMTFKPSATLECGDRSGRLPAEMTIPRDPKKAYEKFKGYFDKG